MMWILTDPLVWGFVIFCFVWLMMRDWRSYKRDIKDSVLPDYKYEFGKDGEMIVTPKVKE